MTNTAQYDSAPLEKYQDVSFDIDLTLNCFVELSITEGLFYCGNERDEIA